jgi:hypothetical protein
MYGRHLAGFGEVQDEAVDQGYALNELRLMEHMDDVKGNGVFDQPGARPNTYPDAGVFGGRYGLPGYIDREVSYKLSEVVDATTGRPVVYVPAGAVSMDSAAQVAYIEGGMYPPPRPVLDSQSGRVMRKRSTENVMQNPASISKLGPKSISGLPFGLSYNSAAVLVGVVGLAGAVAYMTLRGKK